ncbi:MAG: DegT/DnrJ/EryC1/StrS family aminotransferase [Thermoleophilaceae bacterium]|nr:DegT/DnrJ/EryC1/StrS family aminotransferase [Thermoleophilaceae bacterium]
MTTIQVSDPRAALLAARAGLDAAFARVLEGGRYILGEEVAAFEREWADHCGTAHCVGVSSGTDALALGLRALGVGPGDDVLVPAMTALATWMAVAQIGARPVGVDIEPASRGMNPELADAAIGPRTRAIVAVHLFGQPARVDDLLAVARTRGLPLVEDAAQAHGAAVGGRAAGSLGALAAFSFYPTKNLGTLGDAGAVTTADPRVADRVRLLREYGWRTRDDSEVEGVNARLDELQAALLRVMLPGLTAANARRAQIAAAYSAELAEVSGLTLPAPVPGTTPAWHLYVVGHAERDRLRERLASAGIGSSVHYAPAPHLNTAFGGAPGTFPVAEHHARTAVTLPLHPALGDTDVERVIAAVRSA